MRQENKRGRTKMQCNGLALRQHRIRVGWSQEKLALMSAINTRTVQRAEAGEALSLETFSQMASALNVPLSEILAENAESDDNGDSAVVVLRPCVKGTDVVNLLCKAFTGQVNIEVEPRSEWIEETASLLEEIDSLCPDPWSETSRTLSLADRLRKGAAITQMLERIAEGGVALFIGQYTAQERIPVMSEEGHLYITERMKPEFVQCAVLTLGPSHLDRMMVRVTNKYVEPRFDPALDDEIPF
jgi:transcriptional regulator with XRE-family HTH domain